MASKFVVLCAFLAAVNGGIIDAPGHLAYSGHGPVAYSSAPSVSTVYSSVGAPAVALHAAPIAKTVSYAAPVASIAPVAKYSPATAVSHSYSSIAAPAPLTSYAAPAQYAYAAPGHLAYAAPVAKTIAYAPAPVAIHAPAVGSSHQNIVRSFDGTVSHYGKAVDTAFSSVRKYDTRINNNVYTPALAKTVTYAAPAVAAPAVYTSHAAPTIYHHGAPSVYAAPATAAYSTKAISYSPAASVAHVSFEGLGTHYGW